MGVETSSPRIVLDEYVFAVLKMVRWLMLKGPDFLVSEPFVKDSDLCKDITYKQ